MNGLSEFVENKPGMGRSTDPPAHNATRESIDDKGHVNEALPCRHIGEIADPQHVRSRRLELAVLLFQRTWRRLVRNGRPVFRAANYDFEPNVFHHAGNCTAGHIKALRAHLMPDLANAIDLLFLLPDAFDLGLQGYIPLCPTRQQMGFARLVM